MDKDMKIVMEKLIECKNAGMSPSEAMKELMEEGTDGVMSALAVLLSPTDKPDTGNAVDMEVDLDD